jgi:predicted aspartyl protease
MIVERMIQRSLRMACCCTAILACACAHAPPLHSARLEIEESEGGYRAFIRAKVAGESILLLIDTGAMENLLPESFVRARGMSIRSPTFADGYRDATGRVAYMGRVNGVPVQFEGETETGRLDFVVNPDDMGGVGILAPQHLVRSGYALVIDLGHAELRSEPEEAALKRVAAESAAPLRRLEYHKCRSEDLFREYHRVVSISINGVAAEMLVDTGASRTVLARNNPAIPSIIDWKGKRGTTAAMTSIGSNLLVPDVPVEVAGTSFVLPVLVHPNAEECDKGALGADVLRHCTVVWGSSSLWAACRAPADQS